MYNRVDYCGCKRNDFVGPMFQVLDEKDILSKKLILIKHTSQLEVSVSDFYLLQCEA